MTNCHHIVSNKLLVPYDMHKSPGMWMTWKSSARPSSTIELIYSQENRPKSVLHVDKDCGTCKLDVQSTRRANMDSKNP